MELSMGRGKVSVILILLIKRSSQIFLVVDIDSLQLIEPLEVSPEQTVLKEMEPQVPISSVRLNLPHIRTEMRLGTRNPIILCKYRNLELLWDDEPRYQTQLFKIHPWYSLYFHCIRTIL